MTEEQFDELLAKSWDTAQEAKIRADERKAVLAELKGWLVDEDLSEHENDRQCPECSGMWNYDQAKSRNIYRAELRAKLVEMKEGK